MTKKVDTVQAVERAVDLLYCFSLNKPELSINEFVEQTGLKRPTVFRLLTSLKEKGLIIRNETDGLYRLGLPFVGFGQIVSETLDVRKEALPILKELSNQTNETTSLNILQSTHRVCVEKVDGSEDIRQFVRLGYPYPLVRGASGRIFLAFADRTFTENILQEWERENEEEIERGSYYKDLTSFKENGCAVSLGDRVFGAYSISAPIFNASGQMIAGLSISGLGARMNEELEKKLTQQVKDGANKISSKLGFQQISNF
ncbi:IclR family transcriptional regulator [Bacillus sp. FJAT-44742]|uniref:IclR family transcriptional regulator n=1 Tax=Bacillus sp. FJAT-44742 TaxID=2014005 RepID=UPI000C23D284|nr:IclR family transcriptional regulator [Bacillus sp. FJAT-44742]